jgi:cyanophycin synthetase
LLIETYKRLEAMKDTLFINLVICQMAPMTKYLFNNRGKSMRIGEIRTISGPNIYSHNPVLVMKLYLDELTDKESREFDGFNQRLLDLLPSMHEHYCSKGREGGFVERLEEGTYFGHIVEHIALELTEQAGISVFHGKTRYAREPGCYNVVVEYKAEKATRYLLETAVELVEALLKGEQYHLEQKLAETRRLALKSELGPSTRAIVDAAIRRGIPNFRLNEGSLVQLGYGIHRKFVEAALCSSTSNIAVDIASDKELTKAILRQASIPVPRGAIVDSVREAIAEFEYMNIPVAIKPFNGNQGKGVSLNLRTGVQVEHAFHIAQQYSRQVLIEEMLNGRDYRVLVINGKMIAASERIPARVVGDGQHTIEELVEVVNQDPRRGDGHDNSLTRIVLDTVAMEHLRKHDLSIHSVPKIDQVVYLRESANLSTGGTAKDVTEQVHPEVVAMCERAARIIGLDICGIDLIKADIAKPLAEGDGIVEVNAAPGLRMHLSPSEGQPREVGEAIVDMLYPENASGRIPVISVTGTNGKTTITRMIAHTLAETGKTVGLTTTDGIYIDGKQIAKGDTTGPLSARTILSDPTVEIAVLETARGGIVRAGLGYDWSDISIISNIRLDHIGQDGIENLDDLLYIKSLVAERVREGGTLILNADDERLAQLMENPRINKVPKKLIYFSMRSHHVLVKRHLDAGGTAYLLDEGWIVEAAGNRRSRIMRASDIPLTMNGMAHFQIANVLAVIAACRAFGMEPEELVEPLMTFNANHHNSGRANLYQVAGGYVLVDYGHNPDAFESICRMASQWVGRRTTGVIAVPGDRDNAIIEQAAVIAARGFNRLFIKEDMDLRGRRSGETAELLCRVVQQEKAESECRVILDEAEAVRTALNEIQPGEVVVVFYEKLDRVLSVLKEFRALPAQTISEMPYQWAAPGQAKAAPERVAG